MVRNGKSGLFFYKVNGAQANLAFQCGTLCVGPSGIKRTPAQSAGGNPPPANDCSGAYALDFNAFASGMAPAATRTRPCWCPATPCTRRRGAATRASPAPCNTTLSDGLEFIIGA